MKIWYKFSMVGLIVLLLLAAAPGSSGTASFDLEQLTADLSGLEPYMSYSAASMVPQAFDAQKAEQAGFAEDTIALAEEMVAYQLDLEHAALLTGTDDVSNVTVSLEPYPRLRAFFERVQQAGGDATLSRLAKVNACGDWSHPVPNYSPKWGYASSANPAKSLLSLRFHNTAAYACGYNNCQTADFTRGRGYSGPYGYCSSPRFRDHGRVTGKTSFAIQMGEPNPEVLGYVWPYWNWGAYVRWWHGKY